MKTALLWFFGRRIDAVLNCRELAETESAMLMLLLLLMVMMMMIMMVRVMILRGWRGLPYASHQAEGTADASAAGGGARRHCPTYNRRTGMSVLVYTCGECLENLKNLSAANPSTLRVRREGVRVSFSLSLLSSRE